MITDERELVCQNGTPRERRVMRLMCVITFCCIFLAPLQVLVLNNFHYFVLFVGMLCFIKLRGLCRIDAFLCGFIFYFVLHMLLSFSFMPTPLIPLIGLIETLIPLLFWMVFFESRKRLETDIYVKFILYCSAFVAIMGIYQRLVDPTLFGIMSQINSYNTPSVYKKVATIRITSFMPSTQVFSLFMGISVCLCLEYYSRLNIGRFRQVVGLALFSISGLLSGGQTFAVCVVFFVLIFLFKKASVIDQRTKRLLVLAGCLCMAVLFIAPGNSPLMQAVNAAAKRVFKLFFSLDTALHDETLRWDIMRKTFAGDFAEVFWGRGLGTSTKAAKNMLGSRYLLTQFTTESYFLTVIYETGLLGVLLTIWFWLQCIRKMRDKSICGWITVFAVLVTSMFTPAIQSPVFLFFWGIALSGYYSAHNERRLPKDSYRQ